MKINALYFVVCLGLCSVVVVESTAQESTYPVMEETESDRDEDQDDGQYIPIEREKNQYIPSSEPVRNGNYNDATTLDASSSSSSPKSVSANEKQAAKNDADESVLGFNFLYYIIQKFKMSEIVDK